MFIKDVCLLCKLTKKAVEYYEEQGLITPAVMDNGYRNYSKEDVSRLKEVSVLRKLNISVPDIKAFFESTNKTAALVKLKYKTELETEKNKAKIKCLEQLIEDYNINKADAYISENVDKYFTIKEKLLQAFPGCYSIYLCIHFGTFLNESIDTIEKQAAYNKIIDYLDSIDKIKFTDELENYLNEYVILDEADMDKMNRALVEAVDNMDEYLEEHKANIKQWISIKESEEFINSPAFRLQQLLLEFQKDSGYYDIFIYNMKVLSTSYREYSKKLEEANKKFLEKYPVLKDRRG